MGPAGEFLKLLRKPNMAKPKGDQDPAAEWDDPKMENEDEEEAAWREKCANTPGAQADDGDGAATDDGDGEHDAEVEDYQEQEEEAEPADDAPVELDGHDGAADAGDDHMDADHGDDSGHEEDDDKEQKELHAKEYKEMDDARDKLADFVQNESKKRKAEDGYQQDQSWKYRNRNKGNYGNNKGNYGNNKGNYHGYGWRGWWSPKGKGKGKQKWSKPWWGQPWKGSASSHPGGEGASEVLRADQKGGYYLPNGQGYIDANMQYHAHLGLFQC